MSDTKRVVQQIVSGRQTSDGAGVKLTRIIGSSELDHLDPFLLLDEFRSDNPDDYIGGFPDHPHRGFETVTYLKEGEMDHKDSSGAAGTLRTGGVQWMTAGRGVIHSELPKQKGGLLWGFQLWVNLPSHLKMVPPQYREFSAEGIPVVTFDAGKAIVIAGKFNGVKGSVNEISVDPTYIDFSVEPNGSVDEPVPASHNVFIFVHSGSLTVNGNSKSEVVNERHLAHLVNGDLASVTAGDEGCGFLLLAAAPIGEPIERHGPFVMNTREEIRQAIEDYNADKF